MTAMLVAAGPPLWFTIALAVIGSALPLALAVAGASALPVLLRRRRLSRDSSSSGWTTSSAEVVDRAGTGADAHVEVVHRTNDGRTWHAVLPSPPDVDAAPGSTVGIRHLRDFPARVELLPQGAREER